MTQVAALLRPRIRESEITQYKKTKTCYVSLSDWHKVGRENRTSITVSSNNPDESLIKVKVSLVS